ncbi:hypothetical protein, partial [Pseudomonas aeruginosa]
HIAEMRLLARQHRTQAMSARLLATMASPAIVEGSRLTDTILPEVEMRRALGLDPAPSESKQPIPKQHSTFTLVELRVRKNGGSPFRFEHRSRSISTLAAQLEAEKAAREKGYEVWVVLDIRQVSS